MNKTVLISVFFSAFTLNASHYTDLCINADQDAGTSYGDPFVIYYDEKREEQYFHFEEDDYKITENKKVIFEETKEEGLEEAHYAVSITLSFNKKIEVPKNDFNPIFQAAKDAKSVNLYLICHKYSSGSPVPPPPPVSN